MNKEFEVHILSEERLVRAGAISRLFDSMLDQLKQLCEESLPASREFSIVKTKLEEACFFAKKCMANHSILPKNE